MLKGSDLENAYALIIGISNYHDSNIPKLKYTKADAEGIIDILTNPKRIGMKKENIKVFLDENATQKNIKNAMSDWLFRNAKEDSTVIVFFAGHGGVEEDRFGEEKDKLAKYLLPFDTDFDNFAASALSNSEFNKFLRAIKSRRLVVFLDACYSGGVIERKARDVKITENPYENIAKGEGRVVIAASQPDQRSYEDNNLRHGIFTHHLIEALNGAADSDNDGYVTVMEVFKYLSRTVPETAMRLAGGKQEPLLTGDYLKTDIVLTVDNEIIEKKKYEEEKHKKLDRLFEWYAKEEINPELYELACRLLESNHESLGENDKKILKLLNDLLSNKISISRFSRDAERVMAKVTSVAVLEVKEDEEKKNRIVELLEHAQRLFGDGKYLEATVKWNEVLKIDPENQVAIDGIKNASDKIISKKVKKYCPVCGSPNERGLKYCAQCGARLFET